ncbi:periplasmic heavy metal sensor [Bradyrhizobium sp. NBAIM20]|uniref:Spy/CpxP family protein refolding chaperone n=1 Tax=unclassified Bradyrhizobium TaxID=2631580 RepID=UPI001CD5FC92|nr:MULTISPECIES: periplasmic heavy metal sensor [unclassified Bradyrhizobium]MCA1414554.1 periplasmic heavy metal sensor [Bradyrhizobium sp. NBAIM20]MCA1462937.1 periplasmic heavy metal sensor [Bradyrhizobium sp. NBAIM18]
MNRVLLLAASLLLTGSTAGAQSSQPYAGLEKRPIKALSQQQIDDLRAGRGMGLALAAELNGYPGPSHVLELSDRLGLTADQRAEVQRLFDAMKQEAVPLGNKLVEQERALEDLFSSRRVTSEALKTSIGAIAETQGQLRESHLKYHLSTAALLDQSQMQRYADLRGYQRPDGSAGHKHKHHH